VIKSEAGRVLATVKDMLERHIGVPITPELATGIYHTLNHELTPMVVPDAPPKKIPAKKPSRSKKPV